VIIDDAALACADFLYREANTVLRNERVRQISPTSILIRVKRQVSPFVKL
jgi:hypothetical protein